MLIAIVSITEGKQRKLILREVILNACMEIAILFFHSRDCVVIYIPIYVFDIDFRRMWMGSNRILS